MGTIYRKTFFKSEEGIKAFQEIGLPYEDEMWDRDYAEFLRKTQKTPDKERVKSIQTVQRIIASDENEYLVYDLREEGRDALGNPLSTYRHGIGCYHQPIVKYSVKVDIETGEKVKHFDGLSDMSTAFSIPFNSESVEKIKKYVVPTTQFIIRDKGHNDKKVSVDNVTELTLSTAEHALRFGHRASDYEATILADEKQGNYTHHKPPNAGLQYR